jgi:hypothetical protein
MSQYNKYEILKESDNNNYTSENLEAVTVNINTPEWEIAIGNNKGIETIPDVLKYKGRAANAAKPMKTFGILPAFLQKQNGKGYTKNRRNHKKMNTRRRASRQNRRNSRRRASRRQNAGGYQTSQQFFNPDVLPPSTIFPAPSTAPTAYEIRPVLPATFKASGGARGSRRVSHRTRGGFSPSIMGPFVANAQAAIVPLALYGLYHKFVPKRSSGGRTRKASRK